MESDQQKKQSYYIICLDDDDIFLDSLSLILPQKLTSIYPDFLYRFEFINDHIEFFSVTEELKDENIALVICDQKMPGMKGLEVLSKLKKTLPETIRVLLTGYAGLDSAKYAINKGILDQYFTKPIEDYENFAAILGNLIKKYHLNLLKIKNDKEIKKQNTLLMEANEKIKNMLKIAEEIASFSKNIKTLDLEEILNLALIKFQDIFLSSNISVLLLKRKDKNCILKLVKSTVVKDKIGFIVDLKESMPVKKIKEAGSNEFRDDGSLDMHKYTPIQKAIKNDSIVIVDDINNSELSFLHKKELGSSCIIIPFSLKFKQEKPFFGGKYLNDKEVESIGGVLTISGIEINNENYDLFRYKASLVRDIIGTNISNAQIYSIRKIYGDPEEGIQ